MKHYIVVEFNEGRLSEIETAIQLKDWEYVARLLESAKSVKVEVKQDNEPHRRG